MFSIKYHYSTDRMKDTEDTLSVYGSLKVVKNFIRNEGRKVVLVH